MQAHSTKPIFGLDLLRFIAITFIVFSSVFWIVPDLQGAIPQLMSVTGLLGIEIGFVLIGFIVGKKLLTHYLKDTFSYQSLSKFLKNLGLSLLPNYFLAFILVLLTTLYIGLEVPSNVWKYPIGIQNLISGSTSFFYESWPIPIILFSVILFSLLLYTKLFMRTKISKLNWVSLAIILVLVLCIGAKWVYSVNDNVKLMTSWSTNLKTAVIYRLDAVFYGFFAAYIAFVKPEFWKKYRYITFVMSGVLLFVLLILVPRNFWFIETHTTFWNVFYLPLISIAIALALPLLSHLNSAPKVLSKPICFISKIAYAMYIIHYSIVLQLLKYYVPSEGLPKFDIIVYILVYLCLLILSGYLVYLFFEKPIATRRNSEFEKLF